MAVAPSDVLFVLGAGVDRVLELPLLNTLFRDLSNFVLGSGKEINQAIRDHAKQRRTAQGSHRASSCYRNEDFRSPFAK